MSKIDVTDLIADVTYLIDIVNRIEEKSSKAPFQSFGLIFVDSCGAHTIRYSDSFEESKSAVIHQLNKILKFPQNYIYVNVCIKVVELPEKERRTYVLGKNSCNLEDNFEDNFLWEK